MRCRIRAALAALVLTLGWRSPCRPAPAAAAPLASNVHIFYYSWYGNPASQRQLPALAAGRPHPAAVGRRRTSTRRSARTTPVDCADGRPAHGVDRRAGVGVIVYSWWGRDSYEDRLAAGVLAAADRHGIKVAWHLEPYGGRTAASTVADINYIIGRYGVEPRLLPRPGVRQPAGVLRVREPADRRLVGAAAGALHRDRAGADHGHVQGGQLRRHVHVRRDRRQHRAGLGQRERVLPGQRSGVGAVDRSRLPRRPGGARQHDADARPGERGRRTTGSGPTR